jgi:hypothetical protein
MKRAGAVVALICLSMFSGGSILLGNARTGTIARSSGQTPAPIADGSLAGTLQRLQLSAYLSPQIQFDTRGVEFGPWLRKFIVQLRKNWLVPYGAMSLSGQVVHIQRAQERAGHGRDCHRPFSHRGL